MGTGKPRLRHEIDRLDFAANRKGERMKPSDLRAWQERMGITGLAASELLGVSYAAYKDWRRGISRTTGKPIEAGRAVALACAALEAGLRPIGDAAPPVAEFLEQV